MVKHWTPINVPSLVGKVIIITGANSGIGYESAKFFTSKGARVILAVRSVELGEKAKENILTSTQSGTIDIVSLDLMNLESIHAFTEKIKTVCEKIDVLLNNAGIMATSYQLSKDGFESQLATNHLGHFALTGLLLPLLENSPNSRAVTVSSIAHKRADIDFNNLLYKNGQDYNPFKAYCRSKLANLLFAYELHRRLTKNKNSTLSVAAHPGVTHTQIGRHLKNNLSNRLTRPTFNIIAQPTEQGAQPLIRASVDPDVQGGEYYGPAGWMELRGSAAIVSPASYAKDEIRAKKLWEISEELTDIHYL